METAERPRRSSMVSWLVYDSANTIFSFLILSAAYPVWLSSQGLPDSWFAIGNSIAMALIVVAAPFLGALSDQARRRVPFLVASTVACVLFVVPLGFVGIPLSLALFVISNIGFQAGLIFYDALLAVVSTPETRGRVGAWGVGLGYLGSLAGLGLSALIVEDDAGYEWLFMATGAAFLFLALPAFFFIREPARTGHALNGARLRATARDSLRGVWRLLRGRQEPRLSRFLLARALYADAANTMILFMGVYALHEAGLHKSQVEIALLLGIVGALVGAPFWGRLVDRVGPARTLLIVLGVWFVGLCYVVAIPVLSLPAVTFFGATFTLGVALGGTWSADRPLMLALAPPERLGEFYGLYAMVGRFSAVVGPLIWALIVDGLQLGRPTAVLVLAFVMVASFLVLRPLEAALRVPSQPTP